jgi:hypothetical protein
MALLPATGSEIAMGKIRKAYNNVAPGAGQNITLSGTLGPYKGRSSGTAISMSSTFGGDTTPYIY